MEDYDAWTTMSRAISILDNLIAHSTAKPWGVALPNGNPSQIVPRAPVR